MPWSGSHQPPVARGVDVKNLLVERRDGVVVGHVSPVVRERAFGSLKYEHLYRHEISDGDVLAVEAEHYRRIFNTIRPHEALDMRRPIDVYLAATPKFADPETEPES